RQRLGLSARARLARANPSLAAEKAMPCCTRCVNPAMMKRKLIKLSRRYASALQKHLKAGPRASLEAARGLGREALAMGLETLDVARMHQGALAAIEAC